MWPRFVELMLGVWLVLSPVILGPGGFGRFALINTLGCGFLVILASYLSFWESTRLAHLFTVAVGAWLAAAAYATAAYPAPPAAQNAFLVGLMLMLFAIVPNEAASPSRTWRPYALSSRR